MGMQTSIQCRGYGPVPSRWIKMCVRAHKTMDDWLDRLTRLMRHLHACKEVNDPARVCLIATTATVIPPRLFDDSVPGTGVEVVASRRANDLPHCGGIASKIRNDKLSSRCYTDLFCSK